MTRLRCGFLCLTLATAGMATWSTTTRAQIKSESLGDDLYCFASGGGATYFRWCLDAFGLLSHYETPAGQNHAPDTRPGEGEEESVDGFRLTTSAGTYELTYVTAGGFDEAVVVSGCLASALPCTLQVDSPDGKFRITRRYTQRVVEKEMTVEYRILNTSGALQTGANFEHLFNFGLNNTQGDDVPGRSSRSVWGAQTDRFGVTASTFTIPSTTFLYAPPFAIAPNDWAGSIVQFIGNIGAGTTKRLTFQYRRD